MADPSWRWRASLLAFLAAAVLLQLHFVTALAQEKSHTRALRQATNGPDGACTESFLDAIENEGNLLFLSSAINMGGFASKLPDPCLGLTVFAPINEAFYGLLTRMNLGIFDLLSLTNKIPGILLYHLALGGHSPDDLLHAGSVDTILGTLSGQHLPLNFTSDPNNPHGMVVHGLLRGDNARVLKAVPLCQSWLYVIDEILLPTPGPVAAIPDVNLNAILNAASGILSAPCSIHAPAAAAPNATTTMHASSVASLSGAFLTPGFGAPSAAVVAPPPPPPACGTNFGAAMTATPGLEVLVQALEHANLGAALPAAASGVTLFAPVNAAFLQMLATTGLSIPETLALGKRLQSLLLFHVLPGAYGADFLGSAPEQTIQTVLGQNLHQAYNLRFRGVAGQTLVHGNAPGNVAAILSSFAVCGSVVHIVDAVLLPAAYPAAIPLLPAPAATPSPSPIAATRTVAAAAVANVPSCQQSFLQAIQAQNLSFLAQGLVTGGLQRALPDPATPNMLFAPSNAAFYHILTGTAFGLEQLAAVGTDRLDAVLEYHVIPSMPLSPDSLATSHQLNTLLGQRTNRWLPLTFSRDAHGKVIVAGLYPNVTARVSGGTGVCNSTIYIIDEVLLPAASLDAIPVAGISPPQGPSACNLSIADVVRVQPDGTALLRFLADAGLSNIVADPTANLTLLLPTAAALANSEDDAVGSLSPATAPSGRLAELAQYHLLPGGRTVAQLVVAQSLPTMLGPSHLLEFSAFDNGTEVSGASDSAVITTPNLRACASVVHIIDEVLQPGEMTPAPTPAPAALATPDPPQPVLGQYSPQPWHVTFAQPRATPATSAASLWKVNVAQAPSDAGELAAPSAINGTALGAGYLVNCTVNLSKAGVFTAPARTNASGAFDVPLAGAASDASLQGGFLALVPGGPCMDAFMQAPPPFTLGALLPHGAGGQGAMVAVNAITTASYVLRRNARAPEIAAQLGLLGGPGFTAESLYSVLGTALNIANASALISSTDYIAGVQAGDATMLRLQALNAELLASLAVGSHLLTALHPNLTTDEAVRALYLNTLPTGVKFVTAGKPFGLTSPEALTAVYSAALDDVAQSPALSVSSTVGGMTGIATGGRRLAAQAPAPMLATQAAAVAAVSQAVAELNTQLEAVSLQPGATPLAGGTAALRQIAKLVLVAQARVAPAAAQLVGGTPPTTLANFQRAFTGPGLTAAVAEVSLP